MKKGRADGQFSVLIAGSGGQGILFLGKLIAQAAMLEGRNVTWFPSYGAEIRGGTANCTVVISDEAIGSPIVRNPDMLIALNRASVARFQGRLKKDGLLVMDSSLIKDVLIGNDIKVVRVPGTEIAVSLGSSKSANMVVFGAALGVSGFLKEGPVMRALEELTPVRRKKDLDMNKAAIKEGRGYPG
ncbi:MAG: 2-oxoacid:acceptor oxidoreductase family protein [Thermodesulfovibrionales bacterium]|nr:2-oxoacid:acceptor oxidoreductase family protein [Thermodesulfovibrionales bacterium]